MITERILKYLETKGITKYKFCKDLGFSNGFLDKPREISTDKYANILEYFKDINPEWLLTGNGEMIINVVSGIKNEEIEEKKFKEEYDNFYNFYHVRIQRIVDILDKDRCSDLYEDISYRLNMIQLCTEHYSLFKKSEKLTNETDKKELALSIQQILSIEKKLLKIISPYEKLIFDLYNKLLEFDKEHEGAFYLDEETMRLINEPRNEIQMNTEK